MVATADILTKQEIGDFNDLPVKASTTIYEGAMVGDDGSGYARGLVAGDPFRGHCFEQVTCGTTAGAKNVKVRKGTYRMEVTVSGASAVTDVGKQVYGSADNTYTLTKGSNTPVGRVVRWVTSTTCVVEFSTVIAQAHGHTGVLDGGVLTSPHVATAIEDANGAAILALSPTSASDNRVQMANNAAALGPTINVTGTSTNIPLNIGTKGTGTINLTAGVAVTENKDVAVGTSVGTKIGTLSTQKLGFWGATPVVRQLQADPTGSAAASLRAWIVAFATKMVTIGLIKKS